MLRLLLICTACAPAEPPEGEPAVEHPVRPVAGRTFLGPRVIVRQCDPSPSETYAPFREYRVTRLERAEELAAGCVKMVALAEPCVRGRVVARGTLDRHIRQFDQDSTEKSFGEAVREAQQKQPPLEWARREVPPDAYGARLWAAKPVENDTHYDVLGDCIALSANALHFDTDEPEVDVVYSVSARRFLNVFE